MKAKGYVVTLQGVDVGKLGEVEALADAVLRNPGRADILVANAEIARSGIAAEDVTDEHWLAVNDINYHGVFWSNRAFARSMLKAGRGAIVNIGSMSGLICNRPQK